MHAAEMFWMYVLDKACLYYNNIRLDLHALISPIVHDKILKGYCLFSKFVKYFYAFKIFCVFFLFNVKYFYAL